MTFQQAIEALILVDTEYGAPAIRRRSWSNHDHAFRLTAKGGLMAREDADLGKEPYTDAELLSLEDATNFCLSPEDLTSNDWLVE